MLTPKPMATLLKVFFHHSKQHPLYIALIFICVVIAAMGLTGTLLISAAAVDSAKQKAALFSHQVRALPGKTLSLADYTQLREQGFINCLAVDNFESSLKRTRNGKSKAVKVRLIGLDTYPLMNNRLRLRQQTPASPLTFNFSSQAIISTAHAKKLGLAGQVKPQIYLTGQPLLVNVVDIPDFSALVSGTQPSIIMPITLLQQLFPAAKQDGLAALLFINQTVAFDKLSAALPGHTKLSAITPRASSAQMGESFAFNLVAMAALMAIVCFFIVANALSMLMAYRAETLHRLHLLGISKRHTLSAIIFELSVLCLVAAVLGTLLGLWLTLSYSDILFTSLSALLRTAFNLSGAPIVSLCGLAVGASLLAMSVAVFPALSNLYATKKSLAMAQHNQRRLWLAFLCLGCSAGLLSFKARISDMAGLALCLLGMGLLVSATMPDLFAVFARKFPSQFALLHWAFNSGKTLAERCSLSACAYFMALATAVGLATMVGSFREATFNWLNQRLAAPAYVYTDTPEALPAFEGIEHVKRVAGTATVDKQPADYATYPTSKRYQKAMVFDTALPSAWADFSSARGIFINQQMAIRRGVSLGDTLRFDNGINTYNLQVAGIFYDYGNPNEQVFIHNTLAGPDNNHRLAINLHAKETNTDWPAYRRLLDTLPIDTQFFRKQQLLELSMATFDRTFVLTDMLSMVALLVAALSFAMTIALLSRHMDREINSLQTLGIPFSRIAGAVVLQFCLLCFVVTLLALPAGILFAKLLISTVNVNAFGWTYPLSLRFSTLITTAGAGWLLMCLVCAWVFYKRAPQVQQIRYAAMLAIFFIGGCSEQESPRLFAGLGNNKGNNNIHFKYEQVEPNRGVVLPQDHAPHEGFQIEWWYLTAVLKDANNQLYPFQFTVFRFNQSGEAKYMVHASLHSATQHWFEERFAEPGLPYTSFHNKPFHFKLDNWSWQASDTSGQPFPAQVNINWWQGPELRAAISPKGPYVHHGEQGISSKTADGSHISYYYSHPTIMIHAELIVDGEPKPLTGQGWYDHEWTSNLVSDDVQGWDWFSLHLENGAKLMAFRMRVSGRAPFFTGSYISQNGQVTTLAPEDFELIPSRETNGVPLEWRLRYPAKTLDMHITPVKESQWNCGVFNYYEGGVQAAGAEPAIGFMELTGYPPPPGTCK